MERAYPLSKEVLIGTREYSMANNMEESLQLKLIGC